MEAVGAALGDRVDDAAHGPSVGGGHIRGYHFELIDCVLGDLAGDARQVTRTGYWFAPRARMSGSWVVKAGRARMVSMPAWRA